MESFKRGIVLPTNAADAEAWDDSEILSAFDRAIQSHRTRNQQYNEALKRRKDDDLNSNSLTESASKKTKGNNASSTAYASRSMADCLNAFEEATGKKAAFVTKKSDAYGSNKKEQRVKFTADADSSHDVSSAQHSNTYDNSTLLNRDANLPPNTCTSTSLPVPNNNNQQQQQRYSPWTESTASLPQCSSIPSANGAATGFPPPVQHMGAAVIDDAMNAMLMAWYHSGYATGRYQTLLEIQQQQEQEQHQ